MKAKRYRIQRESEYVSGHTGWYETRHRFVAQVKRWHGWADIGHRGATTGRWCRLTFKTEHRAQEHIDDVRLNERRIPFGTVKRKCTVWKDFA